MARQFQEEITKNLPRPRRDSIDREWENAQTGIKEMTEIFSIGCE